jgi:SAM-dependent methyltransferase
MESEKEAARLEAKTNSDEVRRRLTLVGLERGMRVLDAGAGSGAVARVLSDMVGPAGEVVALERSAGRVAFIERKAREAGLNNIAAVEGDLFDPPLARHSFDVVWCQFVLEYLPDAALAVEALCAMAKPGGKVAVADLDGNVVWHYPLPESVRTGSEILERELRGTFDPYAGRKLFHHFRCAGLRDIRVHAEPYHLYAGPAPSAAVDNWRIKFETLRPKGAQILGAAGYDGWARDFLSMLMDDEVLTYSVLFQVTGIMPNVTGLGGEPLEAVL